MGGNISIFVEVITDAVIIWLPIDLLYLYFSGVWSDPNTIILSVELAMLFLLPMFGTTRLYHFIRAERGKLAEARRHKGGFDV